MARDPEDPAGSYERKPRGRGLRGNRAVSLVTIALVIAALVVGVWALLEFVTGPLPGRVPALESDSVTILDD